MQVSALNTIIAAQQARNATPARPAAQATASANTEEQSTTAPFAPLAFKTASAPQQQAASANPYSPTAPLGSQIDIRI